MHWVVLLCCLLTTPAWAGLHSVRICGGAAAAGGGCTVDTTTETYTAGVSSWEIDSSTDGWGQSVTYGGGAKDFKEWHFEVPAGQNYNSGTTTFTCRLEDDPDPSADYLIEWTCTLASGVDGYVNCAYTGSYELSTQTYYVFCLSDVPNWSNRVKIARGTGDGGYDGTGYSSLGGTGWSGFSGASLDINFKFGYCQ